MMGTSGSSLDGGANSPLQAAALPMLELDWIAKEKVALQKHFRMKRDIMLTRLEEMGLKVKHPPKWTFYSKSSLYRSTSSDEMGN